MKCFYDLESAIVFFLFQEKELSLREEQRNTLIIMKKLLFVLLAFNMLHAFAAQFVVTVDGLNYTGLTQPLFRCITKQVVGIGIV